ncbi:MAG: 50S ribosomal protein L7/L12 [Minisyncoccia bacterium]
MEDTSVEVPAKFASIVEAIEKMSVVDLNELVKLFEKKFGVSAAAVAVAAPAGGAAAAEEKSSFGVELTATGDQKIQVIKVIKEALGLGLGESKAIVDAAPKMVKEGLKKEEADELKAKLEAAGAKVTIK